ncbi:MAG TPA: LacI family DNA-binding transcriptional regulator, partial [Roseiflexaceae bacterium]|nr:LacI family DNA-binding transcriptional regulator [Roseiflexaceae bacterium]
MTSIDVARLANVSQSAVSRTFSPNAAVSAKTRELVLAAARQLGYTPNALARSLITRRTNIVGVVMADMTNP